MYQYQKIDIYFLCNINDNRKWFVWKVKRSILYAFIFEKLCDSHALRHPEDTLALSVREYLAVPQCCDHTGPFHDCLRCRATRAGLERGKTNAENRMFVSTNIRFLPSLFITRFVYKPRQKRDASLKNMVFLKLQLNIRPTVSIFIVVSIAMTVRLNSCKTILAVLITIPRLFNFLCVSESMPRIDFP